MHEHRYLDLIKTTNQSPPGIVRFRPNRALGLIDFFFFLIIILFYCCLLGWLLGSSQPPYSWAGAGMHQWLRKDLGQVPSVLP